MSTASVHGHVVLACDKFRGSVTAAEANRAIRDGLNDLLPELDVCTTAVADGGEGTVEALVGAGSATYRCGSRVRLASLCRATTPSSADGR